MCAKLAVRIYARVNVESRLRMIKISQINKRMCMAVVGLIPTSSESIRNVHVPTKKGCTRDEA